MLKIKARKREVEQLRKWGLCVLLSCNSPTNLSKIEQGDVVDFVFKDNKGERYSIRTMAFIIEKVKVRGSLVKKIKKADGKDSYITYIVFRELSEHDKTKKAAK